MGRRPRDESDFRDRPGKRGSRPRTKIRPEHTDAVTGFVTGVDRGRYTLLVVDGTTDEGTVGDHATADDPARAGVRTRTIVAMKARELHRDRVVCGDRVDVVGDTSGDEGSLARIVRIQDRTATLRRTADDTDPYERIVVANADQLVIVTALAQPEPRIRMIDRCVVAAYDAGMDVTLCLTKADLADPTPLRELYEPLGVTVLVTRRDGGDGTAPRADAPDAGDDPLGPVRAQLEGKISVLVGHSGVGKSTLVNALVPDAARATGVVNAVTGRGRQTSTSAVALPLPDAAGWVIDTPGVRSFGLAHVEVEHLLAAFEDLAAVAVECPRGCTHAEDAPDCALDAWVAAGDDGTGEASQQVRAVRVESFRRVLAARTATV
ncbi:ribosome biogenesis GTPase [Sediminihabitans luteus]|uniref:Small ribosomal subunit biogenesis GTPase RsgA n=1 Tax=Sediminihabitans luteus TaxID=1138585 RepID=A0A2M9CDU0_9CELL|nr:ribosome small subunit-dependent GTPase A [Sediminihabitans luteus]PJJ70032.1 ribosome biogenesis GTPase [Sediminihabitans luteus]GIJ00184.1 putative ribosome biogenesis GTPase RsgA [Sediminihabitans luteus]